jgi:integrase
VARTPKPWWREDRRAWFVTIDGQRHNLGPDEKEAQRLFHELMGRKPEERKPVIKGGLTVAELYDKFLSWCQQHREPLTYRGYRDFIQGLLDHLKGKALLPAVELRPFHISEWVDSHAGWGPTRRRNAMVHVQRPYNWAYKLGYIDTNPVRHLEKPAARRRENHVTPEDFREIIACVKDEPFRDLLTFAWETGCRPQEARHVEARHVNLDLARVEIPPAEAKGRKRWRIIRLNDKALSIVKRLLETRKEGALFLNTDGQPWKAQAIVCRFQRLRLALGMKELEAQGVALPPPVPRFKPRAYPDKVTLAAARKEHRQKVRERRKEILKLARRHGRLFAAYDLRHGFAQKMLESGVDHLALAELMGHANGQMVSSVYSHMNRAEEHLKEALRKGSGGGSGA